MQQRQIFLALFIFVLLIAGMFGFAYLKRAEYENKNLSDRAATTSSQESSVEIKRINAKHFFDKKEGVHTLVGSIAMPTPCELLNYTSSVTEGGAQALVSFTTVNNSENCAQVVTDQRFKVSFKAEENVQIKALYNTSPAEFNLFPGAEGENPADFELFIKG